MNYFLEPDLVVFLDVDPEVSWGRKAGVVSAGEAGGHSTKNGKDSRASFVEFQGRVRAGYHALFKNQDHSRVVDANQGIEKVESDILRILDVELQ